MSSSIAFRVDASLDIGTGHVMRCLTLADALRERGALCIFICRQHPGHLLDLIQQRGHEVRALPVSEGAHCKVHGEPPHAIWLGETWATDAAQTRQALDLQCMDWLVVDHYALDRHWEHVLRPHCRKLMVIDDLADRPHDCDLLLDQNLGRVEQDYDNLLKVGAQTLIGPQFALLRPEFAHWRDYSLMRRAAQPQLKNLLITMGGVDQGNATGHVLDALKVCEFPPDLVITVVMGPHAPWLKQVETQAVTMPWKTQVLVGVTNMAKLMANSDLAIGAAGGTALERCALGLPSIVVVLATNQQSGAEALQRAGAAVIAYDFNVEGELPQSIVRAVAEQTALMQLSRAASRLVDGAGVPSVVQKMCGSHA